MLLILILSSAIFGYSGVVETLKEVNKNLTWINQNIGPYLSQFSDSKAKASELLGMLDNPELKSPINSIGSIPTFLGVATRAFSQITVRIIQWNQTFSPDKGLDSSPLANNAFSPVRPTDISSRTKVSIDDADSNSVVRPPDIPSQERVSQSSIADFGEARTPRKSQDNVDGALGTPRVTSPSETNPSADEADSNSFVRTPGTTPQERVSPSIGDVEEEGTPRKSQGEVGLAYQGLGLDLGGSPVSVDRHSGFNDDGADDDRSGKSSFTRVSTAEATGTTNHNTIVFNFFGPGSTGVLESIRFLLSGSSVPVNFSSRNTAFVGSAVTK